MRIASCANGVLNSCRRLSPPRAMRRPLESPRRNSSASGRRRAEEPRDLGALVGQDLARERDAQIGLAVDDRLGDEPALRAIDDLGRICSVMSKRSMIASIYTPAVPPPAGSVSATDFASRSACRNAAPVVDPSAAHPPGPPPPSSRGRDRHASLERCGSPFAAYPWLARRQG